jgi:uncharacterized protein
MIHPDTELRTVGAHGLGVVATRAIPRGTITWARDPLDHAFPAAEAARLLPLLRDALHRDAYVDPRGDLVLAWDHGRLENHACAPTSLYTAYDVEIAVRDIAAGEELTTDYGVLRVDRVAFRCACGAPRCRGEVRPGDLDRHAGGWDAAVREVLPRLDAVAQPLWDLVAEQEALRSAAGAPATLRSCRTLAEARRPGLPPER